MMSGKIKRAGRSVLFATAMLVAGYLVSNIPYPLFDSWIPFACVGLSGDRYQPDFPEDSLLCINVALDKQLSEVVSPEGDTLGHLAVTDRNKLLHLLDVADGAGYRYFFMDVRFPSGLVTDADSALFAKISRMPDFVLSHHGASSRYTIADESLLPQAALADYKFTPLTGFTRYQYLQKEGASVALRMFRDTDGGDIVRWGPLFFSGGKLCRNAQFLMIPKAVCEHERADHSLRYPYLGAHLLDWNTDEELRSMMKGKTILVGDFDEDLHQTYIGDVPGPILSYLAYNDLHQGRHRIPLTLVLFLLALYSVFTWFALGPGDPWYQRVPLLKKTRSRLLRFLYSLAGWEVVFFLFKIALYLVTGTALSSFIPALVLTCLSDYRSIPPKEPAS